MTIETTEAVVPSFEGRWQKFKRQFNAFAMALDYDPHAESLAAVRRLNAEVTELRARLDAYSSKE